VNRWTTSRRSLSIEDFIRGLLNHAGSDVDLQQLIESIPGDLHITGLRDSLCKIMQDYNIQVRLFGWKKSRIIEGREHFSWERKVEFGIYAASFCLYGLSLRY
jgi:hypothetical protein